MKQLSLTGLIAVISIVAALFYTCEVPVDPSTDPANAEIILFTEKGIIGSGVININLDDSSKIGLQMVYPGHFETVRITTSCGVYNKTVTPDTSKSYDTTYFTPVFSSAGACTVFVDASLVREDFNDKSDTLAFYVFSGEPGVEFITVPKSLSTHTGRTDTLLFVTKISGGAGIPVYAVTATPALDAAQFYTLYSAMKDTARVIFNPTAAGTYTVFINAIAPVAGAAAVNATASVEIQVANNINPSIIDVPQTLVAGISDTVLFAVDNSTRSDKLTLKLVTGTTLDPNIFTVLPIGTDSILIRVAPKEPAATETVRIGIATSNGILNDTTWYPLTFIDTNDALWNTIKVAVNAVEGQPVQLDLQPYYIRQQAGTVLFSADIGTVIDTTWKWTPAYGCETSAMATVTATKNDTSSLGLHLAIQVTPGDTTRPTLELVDNALNGKKVSSPQITVECIASDKEAGVGNLTISYESTIVDAALQHDDTYSGIITGLKNGIPMQITITATDKSMRKNSQVVNFTVTYDSTMLDAEPPVIAYVSGPKSGDRVKNADGTITCSISDNSGVDSVWWTLNGLPAGTIAKEADAEYVLDYSLTTFGNNTIVIHAQDGSPNKNCRTTEIKLIYNTVPSGVTTAMPENNATDIAIEPTFSWTGGSDEDGDTVYYRVSYGTTQDKLTLKSSETKENSITITSANKLTFHTTYYWMVTAYTKKPYADTMQSAISSFKTAGGAPVITTQLQPTVKVIEGTTLTLKIEADGTPTPTYKWYKNDTLLTGKTAAEFSKTNVTAGDAGEYFVVVSNGIGSGVTSTKAVVTVRFKANITRDPVAAIANEGGNVTFTVEAVGEAPLSYQWLKNGQVINGATDSIYNYTNTATTDSGKNFTCIVSNLFSRDTSAAAALTVIAEPMYSVTYDANNGSGSVPVDGKTYKSGESVTVLANTGLSRYQYEFDGWRLNDKDNGSLYYAGDKITIASHNIVLYAKWKKETCVVTFDGQGAVPSPASLTVDISSAIGALPTVSSRTGYEFSGWWTGRKGTGDTVGTDYPITEAITLFAKWIIRDYDGNIYTDVTIGTQTWMVENLKVTRYRDGSAAPYYVYDDIAANKDKYGALYIWDVVDPANPKKIAPTGWHVPNDAEWSTLQNYLIVNGYNFDGSTSVNKIGKALASRTDWEYSAVVGNVGNTLSSNNASGFAGMPGGYYYMIGFPQTHFSEIGYHGYWRTSTESSPGQQSQKYYYLSYDSYEFATESMYKDNGYSVRLLRDY